MNYWKQHFYGVFFYLWGFFLLCGSLFGIALFFGGFNPAEFARGMFFRFHTRILSGLPFILVLIFSILSVEITTHSSQKNDLLALLQGSRRRVAAATLVANTIVPPMCFVSAWLFMPVFGIAVGLLMDAVDLGDESGTFKQLVSDGQELVIMMIAWATTYLLACLPVALSAVVLYDAPKGLARKILFVLCKKPLHVIFLICYIFVYMHYAAQLHMPTLESPMWAMLLSMSATAVLLYLPLVWHSCYRIVLQPDKINFGNNKRFKNNPVANQIATSSRRQGNLQTFSRKTILPFLLS